MVLSEFKYKNFSKS